MSPTQLRIFAQRRHGPGRGWKAALARDLEVNRSTVGRWFETGEIPFYVEHIVAALKKLEPK